MEGPKDSKAPTAFATFLIPVVGVLHLMAGCNDGDWVPSALFFACAAWWPFSLSSRAAGKRHDCSAIASAESL